MLYGRWVPNVLARPLAPGDDVVELLARQLASPVRWIECQQALAGLVGRFLEVAPAHAAVLTGLAKLTVPDVELLHAEHDRDVVLERAVASAPAAVPAGADASARDESTRADVSVAPASPPAAGSPTAGSSAAPGVAAPRSAAPLADRPVDAGDALEFVLALQARVRLDQLDPSESVDELFQGVSSRRNQVLIDLGREFGLSGAEGVQRQTIGELVKSLREQGAAYRFPGPYLKDALATGLTRAGVPRTDLGLPPGLTDHVFARVALDTRPGPSARGGDLARLSAGPDVLDRALALTSTDLKVPLARPAAPELVAAPVAVANPALEDALLDSARTLADALGRPFAPPGEPLLDTDPDKDRLAVLDAELGAERATEIAPQFDARRHVRFASAWASARWDLVTAYHDALAGRIDADTLRAELDRIAAHARERTVAETAAYLARTGPEVRAGHRLEHKGARHLYVDGAAVRRRAADRHDRRDRRPAHGHRARRDAADRPAPRPPGRARRGARGVAEDLAGPAAGDGADHRRGAELDRRGAGQTAPARRRQGRDRDLHAHARAAALLPRAVPHERRPAGRAARRARQPRVVLRHRRARAVAATIPAAVAAVATTCASTRSRRRSSRRSPRCPRPATRTRRARRSRPRSGSSCSASNG